MITVTGIEKRFGKTVALKDVDLTFESGMVTILVGQNGAGKTTLLRIVLDLLHPDQGHVERAAGLKVGYMPEDRFGKRAWRVLPFLCFMGRLKGLSADEARGRTEALLRRYSIWDARNKKLKTLSKGMMQRVKWIQANLAPHDLLVLDEPSAGLDPIGKKLMRDWILEEKARGATIIISSHLLEEMERVADRCVMMHNGRILDTIEMSPDNPVDMSERFYQLVKEEEACTIH